MAEKKPSYWEQLRDPRWQQKRLKIMERDGWACVNCGSKSKTFNVHHSYYERGLSPWEYPDESLHCLCEPCHEKEQETMKDLQRELGRLPFGDTDVVVGMIRAWVAIDRGPDAEVVIDNHQQATGVGLIYGLTAEEVIGCIADGGESCLHRHLLEARKTHRGFRDA